MIASLQFEHFKAFQDAHDIELRPLTLIYGSNSSGKSSLLQSLLLFKQTLEPSVASSTVLQFRSGDYVDLGSFENVIYAHRKTEPLVIGLRCRTNDVMVGPFNGITEFSARFHFNIGRDNEVGLQRIEFHINRESTPTFQLVARVSQGTVDAAALDEMPMRRRRRRRRFEVSAINPASPFIITLFERFMSEQLEKQRESTLTDIKFYESLGNVANPEASWARHFNLQKKKLASLENYDYERYLTDLLAESRARSFDIYHFVPNNLMMRGPLLESDRLRPADLGDLSAIALRISRALRSELANISYIGPLRDSPERTYIYTGNRPETVGTQGQNLPDILFAEDYYHNELNRLAQLLGIGYELRLTRPKSGALSDVFAVRLYDKKTRINVGLNDVGFGISQVLPILLESCLESTSVVLVEQPEIHLHPSLQAALGSVLAAAVMAPIKRQFIIETHSEHILLRLQRLIRDGELSADKLRVLFVDKQRGGSTVSELRVAENGDLLDHWPDGFFDGAFKDVFGVKSK